MVAESDWLDDDLVSDLTSSPIPEDALNFFAPICKSAIVKAGLDILPSRGTTSSTASS